MSIAETYDVPYTVQMAERLADYDVRWIEEPVLADKLCPILEYLIK